MVVGRNSCNLYLKTRRGITISVRVRNAIGVIGSRLCIFIIAGRCNECCLRQCRNRGTKAGAGIHRQSLGNLERSMEFNHSNVVDEVGHLPIRTLSAGKAC